MPKIRLRVEGEVAELEASPAFSLLNGLLKAGIAIPHDCGGKARCGTCRVRVLAGEAALTRPGPAELERLDAVGAGPEERLSCQCHASKDVELQIIGRVRP